MATEEIITAACLAFPDGAVRWVDVAEDEDARERIDMAVKDWQAGLAEDFRDRLGVDHLEGGVVRVRMFRADFERIDPKQRFARPGAH